MKGEKLTVNPKPADAKAEKIPQMDFWDLVIGEGKDGTGRSVTYIDSLRLEEALISGTLSFEKLAEVIPSGMTAERRLANSDAWYEKFAALNPKYICIEDNTNFWITSHDRKKLWHDFSLWLQDKATYIELYNLDGTHKDMGGTIEHLSDYLLEDSHGVTIDYVADYPTLQHCLILAEVYEKNAKTTLRGSFTTHQTMHQHEQDQHLKSGEQLNLQLLQHSDPLDILSLLKIMNGFKRAGYEIEFNLTQGPLLKKEENGIVKRVTCRGK